VAAAASVPASSTATNALWNTSPMKRLRVPYRDEDHRREHSFVRDCFHRSSS
jgi:hypothetical protein